MSVIISSINLLPFNCHLCVCVSLYVYNYVISVCTNVCRPHVCGYSEKSEENVRSSGAEATGKNQLLCMDTGNQSGSSGRAANILNL